LVWVVDWWVFKITKSILSAQKQQELQTLLTLTIAPTVNQIVWANITWIEKNFIDAIIPNISDPWWNVQWKIDTLIYAYTKWHNNLRNQLWMITLSSDDIINDKNKVEKYKKWETYQSELDSSASIGTNQNEYTSKSWKIYKTQPPSGASKNVDTKQF
jgi:hypothetical protein